MNFEAVGTYMISALWLQLVSVLFQKCTSLYEWNPTHWDLKGLMQAAMAMLPTQIHVPSTDLVSLSMVCTWTLQWVCARMASCWAQFRHRPPTWPEFLAVNSDFWCFSLPSKSLHVFWDSERSFLERRNLWN